MSSILGYASAALPFVNVAFAGAGAALRYVNAAFPSVGAAAAYPKAALMYVSVVNQALNGKESAGFTHYIDKEKSDPVF